MTERELDEIMTNHWPHVMRRVMGDGSDEWLQGFAKSIARHSKRPTWRPSNKQAAIMRQLVRELGHQPVQELSLIEG